MSLRHLRPLTAGEILDGAFVLYRRHFGTFFATALIPTLPVMAGWVLIFLSGSGTEAVVNLYGRLSGLVVVFIGAALIQQASDAATGGVPSRAAGHRRAAACYWRLVGVNILSTLAAGLALIALILPGIAVYVLFFLAANVVVIEARGVTDSLERSWALARPEWRRVTAVLGVTGVVFLLPFVLLGATSGTAGDGAATPLVEALVTELLYVLVYPFLAVVTTLLYYDCRVRSEGIDLEAAAAELPALAPA